MARGRHCKDARWGAVRPRRWARRGAAWMAALGMMAAAAVPGAVAQGTAPQAIALGPGSIVKEEVFVSKPRSDGRDGPDELMEYREQDGRRRYELDTRNQRGWKYRINTEFRLGTGVLSTDRDTVTYRVPDGLEVRDVTPGHEYELDGANGRTMGHYTFDGKVFTFVFNRETVAANARKSVEGWLRYRFSVDDDFTKTGREVELPGGGVVDIDRVYDLDVSKAHGDAQFNADITSKIYPYTITIDSPHGTPGMVHVADVLKNGRIAGPITVTDGKGDAVALRDAHNTPLAAPALGDAWLPTMQPGERYTITYAVASTVPAASWDSITNTVRVHSSHDGTCGQPAMDGGTCVTDTATTTVQAGGRPWQYKESKGRAGNGELAWVVRINANHLNLKGWTWSDTPDANQRGPLRVQLCRVGADGAVGACTDAGDGPHTFATDDYASYEIRYVTEPTGWSRQYDNASKLCLDGTQECEAAHGSYSAPNPLGKQGQIVAQRDSEGSRAVVGRWTMRLEGGDSGYPADGATEWSVTDTLTQPATAGATHAFTAVQQDVLREAVRKAFGAAAGHVRVDTAPDGTRFTVHVQGWRIPAGTRIEFTVESTLTMTDANNGMELRNCMADRQGYELCANIWTPSWNPTPGGEEPQPGEFSVGKRDSTVVEQWGATDEAQRAGGSYGDTEHDYDALRVSHTMRDGNDTPVPYLEWGVDVVANAAETGDMTIIEHLPQGTELLTGTEAGETNGRAENLAGLVVRLPYWTRDAQAAIALAGDEATGSATYLSGDWNRPDTVEYARAKRNGNDVEITLPAAFLKQHAGQIRGKPWREQRIIITVRVAVPGIGPIVQGERFENRVEARYGGGSSIEKTQTQTITRDASRFGGKEVTSKIPRYAPGKGLVEARNAADYQLNINPKGVCVPDGDGARTDGTCPSRFEFTDVLTYDREIGYDDSEFVLDPASVHVYRPARCVRAAPGDAATCELWENGTKSIEQVVYETSGSGQYGPKIKYCRPGTGECTENRSYDITGYDPVPITRTAQVVELRQSHEYGYTVRQDKPTEFNPGPLGEDPPRYTQTWRNSLTFTVPNEQPLIVQYRYKVFGNPQAWVEPDNTFSLMSRTFSPTDDSFAVNLSTSTAGARLTGVGVDVVKIDADDGAHALAGAHFRLEEWRCAETGGCAWHTVGDDAVTDGRGRVGFDDLRYNRAYRLTETQAPEGYEVGEDSTRLFYIGRFKPHTNMVPEDGYAWECPTADGGPGGSSGACGEQMANDATMWIANRRRVAVLPQAGGPGVGAMWMAGAAMVAVSALGLGAVLRRRRILSAMH